MSEHSEKVLQVRAIARLLWFTPAPAKAPIAEKLYGLGIRVHPEMATLELEFLGPKELGNHRKARPISKVSAQQGMDILRQIPALAHIAEQVEAAQADPKIAARLAAAKTDVERQAIARDLGFDVPDDIFGPGGPVEELKRRIDALKPEDLEPKGA